jgi:purine nucleosidase
MTPRELVVDTDAGSDVDDLLALATIWGSPSLRLRGVTTVYGDTTLRARIVARATRLAGVSVGPIVPGLRATRSGAPVWEAGHEGRLMAGLDSEVIDVEPDAPTLLAAAATVLAVGPLTNVAAALEQPHSIRHLYLMGGSFSGGVEHNIRSDAAAAAAVFDDCVTTTAVGIEQTSRVRLDEGLPSELERCGGLGRLLAGEIRQFQAFSGRSFTVPHDPIAVLLLTDEQLFEMARGRVSVTVSGEEAGTTSLEPGADGPHRIVTDLDPSAVAEQLTVRILSAARAAG